MQNLTEEEFKRMYGEVGVSNFAQSAEKKPNYIQRVKENAKAGWDKSKSAFDEIGEVSDPNSTSYKRNPTLNIIKNIGKAGSGAVQAATSPFIAAAEPVIKPTVGAAVNYTADKISNSKSVQKYANSQYGQDLSNVFQTVSDYNDIAGALVSPNAASKATSKLTSAVGNTVDRVATKASSAVDNVASKAKGFSNPSGTIRNIVNDAVPTGDRLVNSNVTKALDLTAGDASTFFQNFNEDVGRFIADRNLIRGTKAETVSAIDDFYKQNYTAVRSEIGKVTTQYKPSQVPRYIEALKSVKQMTEGVPGLQKASVEVDNLLSKKGNITLADVQRVKELVDKYHSIYKRSGDVADGRTAEGLNNIRSEIKTFIESEVKKNSGADIGQFNKNVGASRELLDMVEVRSPRGLTKSNLGMGDWATMGAGAAVTFPVLGPLAPLGGIAALFVKKAIQSPTFMLKLSKYLDGLSDARKAKIKDGLELGIIPDDLKPFVKMPPGGKGFGPGAMVRGELEKKASIKILELEDSWLRMQEAKTKTTDKSSIANYEKGLQEIQERIRHIQRYTKGSDGKFTGSTKL